MKKRLMSVIAAAAVMTCGSPLLTNAGYKIVMTEQDHTDYTKLDFMSDDNMDVYIYTGANPPSIDGKESYSRPAKFEKKLSDRIYFNVNDEATDVADTLDKIKLLLKDFVPENGDRLTAGWTGNNYSPDIELEYYIMPVKDNVEYDKPLEITVNDTRKIKEILEKDGFAADLVFTTDVCVPNGGSVSLKSYMLNTPQGLTSEEKQEINAEAQVEINKLMEDNGISIEVKVAYNYVTFYPDDDTIFEDMLEVSKLLYANFDNINAMTAMDQSNRTSIGGIDLSNAVDGDSNCDEQMDMADVVLIMQALANPNKYQLSEQGSFNADLDGNGITVGDAQAIQKILLGID